MIGRVLDALLREDHLGMVSRGEWAGPDHWWVPDIAVLLRVRPDGFLARLRTAEPAIWRPATPPATPMSREPVTPMPREPAAPRGTPGRWPVAWPAGWVRRDDLGGVLAALAPHGDAEAEAGWVAFTAECTQDLAARRLAAPALPGLRRALRHGLAAGVAGTALAEALAAHADHPVYPTGHCRADLSPERLRAYAPEFAPTFGVCWVAVPDAWHHGDFPAWWPGPAEVGLPALPPGHRLVPVHPLTAPGCGVIPAPDRYLRVAPTLSTRTVIVLDDPLTHLKLPLPTATLGRRNVRAIAPGSLADGALIGRLLAAIAAREPRFAGRVWHADETCHGGAPGGFGYLLRRYPDALADATVLPVAALTAPGPADGTLAAAQGGSGPTFLLDLLPAGTFDAYLDLLLDWHVALWLRYGIAVEAHQQNISLVLRAGHPVGLVYRDSDAARVDLPRLARALDQPLTPADFADNRIPIRDPDELADMFITITLHLCATAPLLALRAAGRPVPDPAGALRPRLRHALRRWRDPADAGARAAAALLRARVLAADRLPVKAMVTAGTLLPKQRLGASDINKYYLRTGPNYLISAYRT